MSTSRQQKREIKNLIKKLQKQVRGKEYSDPTRSTDILDEDFESKKTFQDMKKIYK